MIHPSIRTVSYEWVWEAGRYVIELRIYTDLDLNPLGEKFDRRGIDDIVSAVRRAPEISGAVVSRITLVGSLP